MDDRLLITRAGSLIDAGLDDEMFALDVEGGHCFSFNPTATDIWRVLATPMTKAALCEALMATYAIDYATCHADVSALIEMLVKDKLVTLTRQ